MGCDDFKLRDRLRALACFFCFFFFLHACAGEVCETETAELRAEIAKLREERSSSTLKEANTMTTEEGSAFLSKHHLIELGPHLNKVRIKKTECGDCRIVDGENCEQHITAELQSQGFRDYTDYARWSACGGNIIESGAWNNALKKYAFYQITYLGHSATFEWVGREQWAEGHQGRMLIMKATGKQKGSSVDCEMKAGVEIFLCARTNSTTKECNCKDANGQQNLVKVNQMSNLTKPKASCGKWYVGVSTVIQMMIGGMRSRALQANSIVSECLE